MGRGGCSRGREDQRERERERERRAGKPGAGGGREVADGRKEGVRVRVRSWKLEEQ